MVPVEYKYIGVLPQQPSWSSPTYSDTFLKGKELEASVSRSLGYLVSYLVTYIDSNDEHFTWISCRLMQGVQPQYWFLHQKRYFCNRIIAE